MLGLMKTTEDSMCANIRIVQDMSNSHSPLTSKRNWMPDHHHECPGNLFHQITSCPCNPQWKYCDNS
jgi:hypothetical protein